MSVRVPTAAPLQARAGLIAFVQAAQHARGPLKQDWSGCRCSQTMSAVVSRAGAAALPSGVDLGRVHVEIAGASGGRTSLGSAATARRDRRLTKAEREALAALVHAVQLLRQRVQLAGIDDAGTGVTLVLRDREANSGGPWATHGRIAVGARNALADGASATARPGMLLPVDVAIHELVHVVQFSRRASCSKTYGPRWAS